MRVKGREYKEGLQVGEGTSSGESQRDLELELVRGSEVG